MPFYDVRAILFVLFCTLSLNTRLFSPSFAGQIGFPSVLFVLRACPALCRCIFYQLPDGVFPLLFDPAPVRELGIDGGTIDIPGAAGRPYPDRIKPTARHEWGNLFV